MSGIHKLVVDIPDPLYGQFRDMLDNRNETAVFVVKNLIKSWLAEVEGEPKPQHFRRAAVNSRKEIIRPRSDGRRYDNG